jgi:hypothetical protein
MNSLREGGKDRLMDRQTDGGGEEEAGKQIEGGMEDGG